jgi:hypothetical protein
VNPLVNATQQNSSSRSRRAESLADRIEKGATGLAAFAEGISEEEWRMPVSASDCRTVGVIVHHVASAYPISSYEELRTPTNVPAPRLPPH